MLTSCWGSWPWRAPCCSGSCCTGSCTCSCCPPLTKEQLPRDRSETVRRRSRRKERKRWRRQRNRVTVLLSLQLVDNEMLSERNVCVAHFLRKQNQFIVFFFFSEKHFDLESITVNYWSVAVLLKQALICISIIFNGIGACFTLCCKIPFPFYL